MTKDTKSTILHDKTIFFSFLKRTLAIYVVLLVIFVSLGLSPRAVREINNVFFSLFIHDERETNAQVEEVVAPSVILTATTTKQAVGAPKSSATVSSASTPKKNPVVATQYAKTLDVPVKIEVPRIGINGPVLNPTNGSIAALDSALLHGAVRYPGSGTLENGINMFILGHSSNLPVVHNQNFKFFLRLKELKPGDVVILNSNEKRYEYRVNTVRLTLASEEQIVFTDERKLILSTCNTLGAKEERYIVEADFVGSSPIAS